MNILFESARMEDIPVIYSQAKALVDAYEDVSSIDYEKVLNWMERKIERHIEEYQCIVKDGERCAYWRLCQDGELDDFYVLPGFQGQGIGSCIMKKCIEESEGPIWLYVFSRNIRAISFYQRFGFLVREKVGNTRLIMEQKG